MDSRVAQLRDTEFFVLDEVDQMLDLGFVKSIRRVVRDLPKKRQNLFFSATMPTEIRKLAGELLHDPLEIAVTPVAKTADRVDQKVIFVDGPRKRDLLVELFKDEAMSRVIVFTRTKRGADRVSQTLDAVAIHGNKSQGQRERSLAAFRGGKARAMVATDIAARGIDIDGVTHVVNFELPEVAEAYVHRIGRTARAGASGVAISLCDSEETAFLRDIEKLIRTVIPATDQRTGNPRPIHAQADGARNRSQPNRGGRGNGSGSRQPHGQRQRQPERHSQPQAQRHPQVQADRHPPADRHPQHPQPAERHPEDLTGVVFLNRAAKARRDDGRRPQR
jgi:ATP-dependent RNA helicase RhlE